jgi:DDE superfamily endonuclease
MRSPNGWTDRELCESWFLHAFIPFAVTRRVSAEKPIVLTLDGHDSHETPAMKRAAYEHGVVIYCFPSKTTHKLQPLDVVVFSAVQRAWTTHCEQRLAEGVIIDRYNVIHEYIKVRDVVTPELIRKSFKKTGIYPFNPEVFTDADYMPSIASSSVAHLPPSYPAEVPSSPLAITTDDDDANYEPGAESDSEDCQLLDDLEEEMDVDNLTVQTSTESEMQDTTTAATDTVVLPSNYTTPGPFLNLPPSRSTRSHSSQSTSTVTASASASASEATGQSTTSPHVILSQKPDWQKSFPELISELNLLRDSLRKSQSELRAANAHCTIVQRKLGDNSVQIDNLTKKKSRGSTKVKARFVSLPELKEAFEAEEVERKEQERVNAVKEAQKTAETAAHNVRITTDSALKIFDSPLSSYKLKDDIRTIAGALGIATTGTVAELTACIKNHLRAHPELVNNPRFAGLYQTGRRRAKDTQLAATQQQPAANPPLPPTSESPGLHFTALSALPHHPAFEIDPALTQSHQHGPVSQPSGLFFYSQSSSAPFDEATYNSLPSFAGSSNSSHYPPNFDA